MTDLLGVAAGLVDIPSVSHEESALADHVEAVLRAGPHLRVDRVGDSVVARTTAGRAQRLLLAGHLDTVPPFGAPGHRIEGDTLFGLGAVDMKGGLAVLLDLALAATEPAVDATFVFYPGEEVERRYNGLSALLRSHPELLAADAGVLAEPTGGVVEAGCQGTLRVELALAGRRAHTARPWVGSNAVHRLAPVLAALASYTSRRVTLDGCEYREQLQAVRLAAGVANNVVPDQAVVTINLRFAPDRDVTQAEAEMGRLLAGTFDPAVGDRLTVVDVEAGAPPALGHPLLASLVGATGSAPRAKLGWTDVATLWAAGMAATNFGPGDPLLAHTADERVSGAELTSVRTVLARALGLASPGPRPS